MNSFEIENFSPKWRKKWQFRSLGFARANFFLFYKWKGKIIAQLIYVIYKCDGGFLGEQENRRRVKCCLKTDYQALIRNLEPRIFPPKKQQ